MNHPLPDSQYPAKQQRIPWHQRALLQLSNHHLVQRVLHRMKPLPESLRLLRLRLPEFGNATVLLDPTDSSHFLIFNEIFRDGIYNLNLVPFVPDLILDCGGHIGLFTLIAQKRFPVVPTLTFEPNPENLPYLRSQLQDNQLTATLLQAAVSHYGGTSPFAAGCSCSGSLVTTNSDTTHLHSVEVIDLPAMLMELNPKRLLIKMDIEGGEDTLLPALIPLLPLQTALFFETHSGLPGWQAHAERLTKAGFHVTQTSLRGQYADGVALRH